MPSNKILLFFILLITMIFPVKAQHEDLTQVWPTVWVEAAEGTSKDFSVNYFRKTFELDVLPDSLLIHTSGDQIYQLFVNGHYVTRGPQTGDLRHWHYETTDIKPFLMVGKNVIAAAVMNYGSHPPDARLTVQTGFLLAADKKEFRFLNTGESWKAIQSKAYSANRVDATQVRGYYGGGSREIVDGRLHIWNWEQPDFEDSSWKPAKFIERAYAKTCLWASRWKLTPRTLPQEEFEIQRFSQVRQSENAAIPGEFPLKTADIVIHPNTRATILLDFGKVTTAYPILTTSKGRNASIKITYSEAGYLGDVRNREKGNRNDVEGKSFTGYFDLYVSDGEVGRVYKPFWWRTFRYVLLNIETTEDELVINDFTTEFSAYPFSVQSKLEIISDKADTALISRIIETGIRTVRLCSHETFNDCPYYEESQFQGDARIQALVSYLNFGDGRLGKNAIEQFSWSMNEEGFQSARYPTNSMYYIPNYSLYWIGMLHDYMMYFDDEAYVKSKLNVSRNILKYFISLQRADGTIKKPAYHNFVDWSFKEGEPPFDAQGYSAIVDLHFLMALQWAILLEEYAGEKQYIKRYKGLAKKISSSIRDKYWNDSLQLFSDTPEGKYFSQHTNCLAILTGIAKDTEAKSIMKKVLKAENMTKATLYWSFYVFEALKKAGMKDEYLDHLGIWEQMLAAGATTWPETGLNSRSECHGWGASPNYHFYKLTAGIESAQPGFKHVNIQPDLQNHHSINSTIPHHNGKILIEATRDVNNKLTARVELPEGTHGTFFWENKKIRLKPGINQLEL
jgi:alpha-L-rhamnosidase